MTTKTRPSTPQQFIAGLDPGQVLSRMVGHNWGLTDSADLGKRISKLVFSCASCTTTREDHIHRGTGELVHRHYTYPSGYRKPKSVTGRVNLADVRVEFLRRLNSR